MNEVQCLYDYESTRVRQYPIYAMTKCLILNFEYLNHGLSPMVSVCQWTVNARTTQLTKIQSVADWQSGKHVMMCVGLAQLVKVWYSAQVMRMPNWEYLPQIACYPTKEFEVHSTRIAFLKWRRQLEIGALCLCHCDRRGHELTTPARTPRMIVQQSLGTTCAPTGRGSETNGRREEHLLTGPATLNRIHLIEF